jgi:hypothetical protein
MICIAVVRKRGLAEVGRVVLEAVGWLRKLVWIIMGN